jgi:hypothetical protein
VLRRIIRLKRHEIIWTWRKLRNEELHNLQRSPNIIIIIKWRSMRWEGHATGMSKRRNACRILVGKPDGEWSIWKPREMWEISLKGISEKCDWLAWTELIWHRIRTSAGLLLLGQSNFGFHKMMEFFCVCVALRLATSQEGLCSVKLAGQCYISFKVLVITLWYRQGTQA